MQPAKRPREGPADDEVEEKRPRQEQDGQAAEAQQPTDQATTQQEELPDEEEEEWYGRGIGVPPLVPFVSPEVALLCSTLGRLVGVDPCNPRFGDALAAAEREEINAMEEAAQEAEYARGYERLVAALPALVGTHPGDPHLADRLEAQEDNERRAAGEWTESDCEWADDFEQSWGRRPSLEEVRAQKW